VEITVSVTAPIESMSERLKRAAEAFKQVKIDDKQLSFEMPTEEVVSDEAVEELEKKRKRATKPKGPPPPKYTKPKKIDEPVDVIEPAVEVAVVEQEEAVIEPAITRDSLRGMLQEVMSKRGIEAARAIMSDNKCRDVSSIPEEKFTDIAVACEQALKE
jgi:hypothetical protein